MTNVDEVLILNNMETGSRIPTKHTESSLDEFLDSIFSLDYKFVEMEDLQPGLSNMSHNLDSTLFFQQKSCTICATFR